MAIRTDTPVKTASQLRPSTPSLPVPNETGRPRRARHGAVTARPSLAGRPDPTRVTRQLGPAGRVLVVGLVCFGLWSLLAAPSLRRSAQGSPLGLRRAASLAVLRPLARLSSLLSLDRIGREADRALDRTHTPPEEQALPPIPPLTNTQGPTPSIGPRPSGSDAGELRPSPKSLSELQSLLPVLPPPSAKHPLRILVVGDSMAGDLGFGLARILSDRRFISVKIDARTSTGLARDDYFNWPYQLALDIRSYRPTVVVMLFGGNDTQGFIVGGHGVLWGTSEWHTRYSRRVAFVMNEVTKSKRQVVWVGMPIVRSSWLSNGYRGLDRIYQAEARQHRGVMYVDSWKLFTDHSGRYAPYLRGPGGDLVLMREGDGIHLTFAGGDRIGRAVFGSMRQLWAG